MNLNAWMPNGNGNDEWCWWDQNLEAWLSQWVARSFKLRHQRGSDNHKNLMSRSIHSLFIHYNKLTFLVPFVTHKNTRMDTNVIHSFCNASPIFILVSTTGHVRELWIITRWRHFALHSKRIRPIPGKVKLLLISGKNQLLYWTT